MKDKTIKKVLVVGSGPIVIGQAAEFDYSGTQVCLALREEGVKTVLLNSNPATIQTDESVADKIYFEPMNCKVLEKIIKIEKPDGVIATAGGQTALNLATGLKSKVKFLGTGLESIKKGEDRGLFCSVMNKLGQPILPSKIVSTIKQGVGFVEKIKYPVIIRSLYTLGGTGSGVAHCKKELEEKLIKGFESSPEKKVLLEKSVSGWGELEYEVVRDAQGNKLMVCAMENIDPMGVHTGESIVVAPLQTISDKDHQKMRWAALEIVEELDIKGGCNVQFAYDYKSGNYYVIEVNPRLSRSSALASKATGYPIAWISAKIALGYTLPEIINPITGKTACFEPALDYVVIKMPKWPDDKFSDMNKQIGMTMKSTGETMAIGRSFEEAMYKAIAGLDFKQDIFYQNIKINNLQICKKLATPTTDRINTIFQAIAGGVSVDQISKITRVHSWFVNKFYKLHKEKEKIKKDITVYKMVDSCAGEFTAITPYFYSTRGVENEAGSLNGPKVIIIGSGPIKIGQGIEFDYLTVHAVKALNKLGIKAIIINNNPETVSTDFSISDRLYFEPLSWEFVSKVIENEKDGLLGVMVQFGGQTAINLAEDIANSGTKILGTSFESINLAENRQMTAELLGDLDIEMPVWKIANNKKELSEHIKKIGFPLLIRPSFVIAGEGMILAHKQEDLSSYWSELPEEFSKPFLIDSFLADAKEVDIDFISNGKQVLSFVLEQIEPTGIHSGDSHCVYPPQSLSKDELNSLKEITDIIAKKMKIIGIGNIQCAIKDGKIYVLEINPRASRTIPFLGKALGVNLVQIAVEAVMKGELGNIDFTKSNQVYIKKPIFSLDKMVGVSNKLGPVMKSTGEMMTSGKTFDEAWEKINKKV